MVSDWKLAIPPPIKWIEIDTSFRAQQINSTPFFENRYQKIAVLAERCCYFCEFSPQVYQNRADYFVFSVLHKAFTAFAYKIRAPPSEV